MNPERSPSPDSPAKQRGRALHKLVLEGEAAFAAVFATEPQPDAHPGCLVTLDDLKAKAFIGIAFLGYAVGGIVPGNDQARWRYFKRFQSPSVTGLGLGLCTILLDFAIKTATLGLELLERLF